MSTEFERLEKGTERVVPLFSKEAITQHEAESRVQCEQLYAETSGDPVRTIASIEQESAARIDADGETMHDMISKHSETEKPHLAATKWRRLSRR